MMSEAKGRTSAIFLGGATAAALVLSSQLHSYLLFHCLVEIGTIAIGINLFILTWNARRFLSDSNLQLLGIGYVHSTESAKPLKWTKSAALIIESVERAKNLAD